ncbi:hypothetical protein [Pseudoduganella lutea]|uniref:Uncharacterized protein n=1 Tax=Pseudoduganella lutea TaxID=321985 RepID=A0A4V0Z3G2_9BURK|nr:hypothetical protein [Pseudoduganella lutea]QBE63333.1 hypothetical protein EWM63_10460 [Pseudoduganella lutea]
MKNSLTFNLIDDSDGLTCNIIVLRDQIIFATTVYTDLAQFSKQIDALEELVKEKMFGNQRRICEVHLGAKGVESPGLAAKFECSETGRIRVFLGLRSLNDLYGEAVIDACSLNLVTEIGLLDSFIADARSIKIGEDVRLCLL